MKHSFTHLHNRPSSNTCKLTTLIMEYEYLGKKQCLQRKCVSRAIKLAQLKNAIYIIRKCVSLEEKTHTYINTQ